MNFVMFKLRLGKKGQEEIHTDTHDHHALIDVTALAMGLTILIALALIIYILINYVRTR